MRIEKNYSLKKLNTWRVGGCADLVCWPENLNDLKKFLSNLEQNTPVTFLGLGSNVLIRDGGIRGVVVITANLLKNIEFLDNNIVRAEAGVPCPVFAKICSKNNLTNSEFFAGIPGTIGGALNMNAGAFGGETWNLVDKVEVINIRGETFIRNKNDFEIKYRHTKNLKEDAEWFIAGYFKLENIKEHQDNNLIKDLLKKRSDSQPIGKFSCGSVFRNPPNNYSAKLIQDAGLKGVAIGGAQVSEKHANFIINDKTANAANIEDLIHYVKSKILDKFGVELISEVHILGEHEN